MSSPLSYHEAWFAGFDGSKFYTRTYPAQGTPRAAVVFVHGFAEHVGRYELAHTNWAARGVTVFAFDQRGFGRTALDKPRSAGAAYGKTSHKEQISDIEWWIKHVKNVEECAGLPLFLFGHSMGGALVLAFPTQVQPPPSKETVTMLSGVVSSSPLILQTTPASKLLRKAGAAVAVVAPWTPFPAKVPVEDLSHDPVVNQAVNLDPWIKTHGTFRGLADMLNRGEQVLYHGYKHWPKTLPLLIVHGTEDKVTSAKASEDFYNTLDAEDKKLSLYKGGFHELSNEPDGVKQKFWDECVSWILDHVPQDGSAQLAKL